MDVIFDCYIFCMEKITFNVKIRGSQNFVDLQMLTIRAAESLIFYAFVKDILVIVDVVFKLDAFGLEHGTGFCDIVHLHGDVVEQTVMAVHPHFVLNQFDDSLTGFHEGQLIAVVIGELAYTGITKNV